MIFIDVESRCLDSHFRNLFKRNNEFIKSKVFKVCKVDADAFTLWTFDFMDFMTTQFLALHKYILWAHPSGEP
jgi:hypothetical protein